MLVLPVVAAATRGNTLLRQACSAGYTVYHGAREGVLSFFSNLGFQMPPRKGIAEFLEELVSPKDQAVSPGVQLSMVLRGYIFQDVGVWR